MLSSFSVDVDFLILLIALIVGFWSFWRVALFYFIVKSGRKRHRRCYITGERKVEKRWISIPICDHRLRYRILTSRSASGRAIKQDLPPADETIRVIGQQWLGASSTQVLITKGTAVTSRPWMSSTQVGTRPLSARGYDVLHSLWIPAFRLKQDACRAG